MVFRLSSRPLGRVGQAVGWVALFFVSVLGMLPWLNVQFPIVDLAEMVYEVRRLQLGYVPYRDTFTHHFVGYIVPFWLLNSVLPLTPVVLKVVSVCFNVGTAITTFFTIRDIADRNTAWLTSRRRHRGRES